jgi:lipid A ethanolaminephosphotransferase
MPAPAQPIDPPSRGRFEIHSSVEGLIVATCLFWTLSANTMFFSAALREHGVASAADWGFLFALGVALTAVQLLALALVATRRTVKPLVALLVVGSAAASYFMQAHGVYLDPGMLRNVLNTGVAEARELLNVTLALHVLLYAGLPLLLLWHVRVVDRPWRRAVPVRALLILLATVAAVASVLMVFQPLASLMRNHKEVRYLMTPANLVYSTTRVLLSEAPGAVQARTPIGLDAAPGAAFKARHKPTVVVVVVGETVRAANWGLSGYGRETTPELRLVAGLINSAQVTSCGTSTEVSLPCMFAPVGRRDYDEARIRREESLLHVVARAGVAVHWIDNNSGCKGVCDGLPQQSIDGADAAAGCVGGRCLDELLLPPFERALATARGTSLIVLHPLGNHGPAYSRRYPREFARFLPDCRQDELSRCSREEIVNAYDNATLYGDHLLASVIKRLQARSAEVDAALVFVSDHGESLGESGLYLHGMPYAIAPDVQKRVPMVMWLSEGLSGALQLSAECLATRARQPASHDNLFHSLLGLLDVRTALYDPTLDVGAGCRNEK